MNITKKTVCCIKVLNPPTMAKEVKRQHYVPRTYLKNFSVERNNQFYIKALPIDYCKENAIYESSIANVCLQNNLYTLPGETEAERMLIEKFYSDNYETYYHQVYDMLIDPNKKTITEQERELIISTVVTMFYRTTKWINQHNTFFNRVLEAGYNLAVENGFDYFMFENRKVSFVNKTLEDLQKEYKYESRPSQVITQLEVSLNLINLRIATDQIMVVKLDEEAGEFITSDNPVIYSNPMGETLAPFDSKNILQLPLDNRHLLLLIPSDEHSLTITRIPKSGAMGLNQKLTANFSQFNNAEKFILGSEPGLKSYISTKEETERPLTPEESKKFDDIDAKLKAMLKELGI